MATTSRGITASINRADLAPGMRIENTQTGFVGVVRSAPGHPCELVETDQHHVAVVVDSATAKKREYPRWRVDHLAFFDA